MKIKVAVRGFTLIEMLVSLAITMMMMGAAVTLFQNISDSVAGSRSIIEMSDRLRATRNRLQADLIGATATMTPPLRPESDEGYFEYIEGPDKDYNYSTGNLTMFGDTDDVLMFTVRSRGEPFIGKLGLGATIESQAAEVIYFCVANGPIVDSTTTPVTRLSTLYRRVLLVSPSSVAAGTTQTIYDVNDLSVRLGKSGANFVWTANSLGDLTKRENRFSHLIGPTAFQVFPFFTFTPTVSVPMPSVWPPGPNNLPVTGTNNMPFLEPFKYARLGDDVLLTNVLEFDVQVYDRAAPIFLFGGFAIEERDNYFNPNSGQNNYTFQIQSRLDRTPLPNPPPQADAYGCYVNLGYYPAYNTSQHNNQDLSLFSGNATFKSGLSGGATRIWDTWSLHYENDSLDEDGDGKTDAGANGLDDDGNGLVDDAYEFDTLPPYSSSLRGIRVTIRAYEPNSQQVRQVTVVQDFLPE